MNFYQLARKAPAFRPVKDSATAQPSVECVECDVLRAGHARLACEVSGAYAASSRNPPKRLTRGIAPPMSAVGISGLQAGEDVKSLV